MLPAWLDGRTLTLLAALIALGTLIQTSFSDMRQDMSTMRDEMANIRGEMANIRDEMDTIRGEMGNMRSELHRMGKELNARIDGVREKLRAEIHSLRVELRADLGELDDRLRVVEIDVAAIRVRIAGLDARSPATEQHTRHEAEAAMDLPGG